MMSELLAIVRRDSKYPSLPTETPMIAWRTPIAAFDATCSRNVNFEARSTMDTSAPCCFAPMIVSTSQSPIRVFCSTMGSRSLMSTRCGYQAAPSTALVTPVVPLTTATQQLVQRSRQPLGPPSYACKSMWCLPKRHHHDEVDPRPALDSTVQGELLTHKRPHRFSHLPWTQRCLPPPPAGQAGSLLIPVAPTSAVAIATPG